MTGIIPTFLQNHFADRIYRRLVQNAGWLMGGNALAGVLGLISVTLAARALGPELFGVLVLISGYVLLIDGLVNFQSWQSVIKFGADAQKDNDPAALKRTIKVCLLVDLLSAAAGAVIAFVLVDTAASFFNWGADSRTYAQWFSLVILLHISGTPVGILRLHDRFRVLAYMEPVAAVCKLVGVILVVVLDMGLAAFIIVWAVADIMGKLFLIGASVGLLRKEGLTDFWKAPLRGVGQDLHPMMKFLFITNVNSSVNLSVRRLDILIVGAMLGDATAGLYRIMKMFAQVPGQFLTPIYHAVYPQIAKDVAAHAWNDFHRISIRLSLSVGALSSLYWVGYIVAGYPFITLVFGDGYADAWVPGLFYLVGTVISAFALPLQPAALSFGRPGLSLRSHLIGNIVYVVILVVSLPLLGLAGAGVSYIIYYLVWTVLMFMGVYRLYSRAANAEAENA